MEYMLIVLCLVCYTYGQVATPRRELGLVYQGGSPGAKVRLDFFIDPLCPDTAEAWHGVLSMARHYGADNVLLLVQPFPLPYHQNAFYISKAAYVIHAMTNGTKSIDWLEHILFNEISNLNDRAYFNKSDDDLLKAFAVIAESLGLDSEDFIAKTDRRNSNEYERYARKTWKMAASRGVAGTPTYFINGVYQPQIQQSWSLDDWKTFMDPLVADHEFDFGNVSTHQTRPASVEGNTGSPGLSTSPLFLALSLSPIAIFL